MIRRLAQSELTDDGYFYKWLSQNRTKLTLQAGPENISPVRNEGAIDNLKNKRLRTEKRKAYARRTLYYFHPSPQTFNQLLCIRDVFRSAAAAMTCSQGGTSPELDVHALLRRKKDDLLTIYQILQLRTQQKIISDNIRPYANLSNGYSLVVIASLQEAIFEGERMRNCLRDLGNPPSSWVHPMGAFVEALESGNLLSLRNEAGKSFATLRFSNDVLVEVRGFGNSGLNREHAMILREYFLDHPTNINLPVAERVGLFYQAGRGLVPYEDVLPALLYDEKIDQFDLDGWPIVDDDLLALRGRRNIRLLSIIDCVNLTSLPEDIGFIPKRGGVFVQPRSKQSKPITIAEANEWLAYKASMRPSGVGHHLFVDDHRL